MPVRPQPAGPPVRSVGVLSLLLVGLVLVSAFWLFDSSRAEAIHGSVTSHWTCNGGGPGGPIGGDGDCFDHHSYANARVYYELSVGGSWGTPVDQGRLAWDRTNGHEFDFIREYTDTSTNSNIRVITGDPCGNPSWAGCARVRDSGDHIVEGTSFIEFRSSTTSSLRDDLSAHEFGHLLGLGHSSSSWATMYSSTFSGGITLATDDRDGRCAVYYHARHYHGGC